MKKPVRILEMLSRYETTAPQIGSHRQILIVKRRLLDFASGGLVIAEARVIPKPKGLLPTA